MQAHVCNRRCTAAIMEEGNSLGELSFHCDGCGAENASASNIDVGMYMKL